MHIDIDPSSISKIINAHFPIVGDIKEVVKELLEELKKINLSQISMSGGKLLSVMMSFIL